MNETINKLISILIILLISGLLFKLIAVATQLLLKRYTKDHTNASERKLFTQIIILKRIAYTLLTIVTAGTILTVFDSVRALGASVLTTAGLIGLVITFTAQRSLGSIFSSLEIALTQLINIGDRVQFNNHLGFIEEITFRSVVIKLKDHSRLMVPTSQFLEHPFQSWSRTDSSHFVGEFFLYVDFTLPVSKLRARLEDIVAQSVLWDQNTASLQVNELKADVMQLKITVSARNLDELSDLLAYLKETLIMYVTKQFPNALPKTRSEQYEPAGAPMPSL